MPSLLLPAAAPEAACVTGPAGDGPPEAIEVMPCRNIQGGRAFWVAASLASALASPSAPESTTTM